MRKSRFTDAQIVDIVREYDAGVSLKELARDMRAENFVGGNCEFSGF